MSPKIPKSTPQVPRKYQQVPKVQLSTFRGVVFGDEKPPEAAEQRSNRICMYQDTYVTQNTPKYPESNQKVPQKYQKIPKVPLITFRGVVFDPEKAPAGA